MSFNETDVRKFYRWLGHRPEEYTEIRAFPWPQSDKIPPIQKFVQNENDFVKICKRLNGKRQIYAGINPRKRRSGSTKDVARVIAIPFDVDSDHPTDKAATEKELDKAKDRCIQVNSLLITRGYKQPYNDMSGNGYRVALKVDIPITDDLLGKLESFFHEIDDALPFTMDSIFDLPRIIKVPGTMSIKGIPSKERPHRLSRILTLGYNKPDEKLAKHIQELEPYTPIITTIIEKDKKRRTSGLRPCFKRFTEEGGTISEKRSEDHLLRLALVTEAHFNGYNRDQIVKLFEKAEDWKEKKTKEQVDRQLGYIAIKGLKPWTCKTILKHKGCLGETCPIYKKQIAKYLPKEPLEPNDPKQFFQLDKYGNPIKFIPKRLGDAIQKDRKFIATSEKSIIWIYNPENGIWENNGSEIIEEESTQRLKELFKKFHVTEVKSYIRYTNYKNSEIFGGTTDKIVMKNGVFNINTEKLTPFDPEIYAINNLSFDYNPEATFPQIEKFINEVLPIKERAKIYEIIGYCLYKLYPIARIFVFSGSGYNGKTQLINIISNFLNKDNVISLTLQEIADDRFAKAQLHGKLANLAADIPADPIKHSGIIKALTGGDKISAQHKFLDRFEFQNYAKLIFSANEVPKTFDNTIAFFRRMVIVPFTNIFPAEAPGTILDIGNKISTPEELSGLFNHAIKALKRLLKNRKFTGEGTAEERKEKWILESNPAQYFINNFVEEATNIEEFIKKSVLYKKYVQLCHALKRRPIASNKFSVEIKQYLPYIDEGTYDERTGKRERTKKVRVWYGIKLKMDELKQKMEELGTIDTIDTINHTPISSPGLKNYINKKR